VTFSLALDGQEVERSGLSWAAIQLRQILTDYNGLGDFRKLTLDEISFFYEPLIPGLAKYQKQQMEQDKK